MFILRGGYVRVCINRPPLGKSRQGAACNVWDKIFG